MPSVNTDDITFRANETDKTWSLASTSEHVLNTIQRIMYMVPGSDIYDTSRGLDIRTRARKGYKEGDRDLEFERQITEQLNKYTNILVSAVVCIFQNGMLIVSMLATYDSVEYRLRITSDPLSLSNLIERG